MSSIRVSSAYKTDSIKCTKCGRKYSKNTSATRQQYFCSSCGADLPYPKQDEKKPLLPESGYAQKQNNKKKRIGIIISCLLIFAILFIIYFLFINPSTSIISPNDDEPIHHFNTSSPTTDPTLEPTMPSISPTIYPTGDPTINPTKYPTMDPTINPTKYPTVVPTAYPTEIPTLNPTLEPTKGPTKEPTLSPTTNPTHEPTGYPSLSPTNDPTKNPTMNPSPHPTTDPTKQPSYTPSRSPTKAPTNVMQSAPFIMGMSIGAGTFALLILICIIGFVVGKKRGYNQYKQQRKYDERMMSHDKAEANADNEDHQSDIVMA